MYGLELYQGDFVLESHGVPSTVIGVNQLIQDLSLWLLEELGGDLYHPGFGTKLESLVGSVMNKSSQLEIHSEILRCLGNYQKLQQYNIQQAMSDGTYSQKFLPEEILAEVGVLSMVDIDTGYKVTIPIKTLAGTAAVVNLTVDGGIK